MNDTYICQVYRKNIANIDGFRCFINNLAAGSYDYNFGYICIGLLSLIVYISIFGKIKGNYRWFILNQAIWDMLVSYEWSCDNQTSAYVKPSLKCFYSLNSYELYEKNFDWLFADLFIFQVISNNAFSALFLLSVSRFMTIYYTKLSEKFTRGRRIFLTIIIFYVIVIFCDITYLFVLLVKKRKDYLCKIQHNLTTALCTEETNQDFMYNFYQSCQRVFTILMLIKPLLFLIGSMLSATMIVWSVAKQAKFQSKHNRKDFKNSIRIAVVIFLQIMVNFFVFSLETIYQFEVNFPIFSGYKLYTTRTYDPTKDYTGYIDFRLPLWLDGPSGLIDITVRKFIIQLRVFIETTVVLFIMSGYREAMIDGIKYFYFVVRHPRKVYVQCKSYLTQSKVSSTSVIRKY